eukprot:m.163988 g.163988  ORF g.163988 m.163988 type:complete len:437 (-) comp16397_c4_seq2:5028-6338(-)
MDANGRPRGRRTTGQQEAVSALSSSLRKSRPLTGESDNGFLAPTSTLPNRGLGGTQRSVSTAPVKGFGSQSARFSVAGTYPRSLRPGTCIAACYTSKDEDRRRGPGMHNVPLDDTYKSATKTTSRSVEAEWSRQSNHPHRQRLGNSTVHQRLKKQKEKEARHLGPGSYPIKSFGEDTYGKIPMSLNSTGPRLTAASKAYERLPDPTAYADARDKYETYAKGRASPSKRGIMEASGRNEIFSPKHGVDLAPGQYADAYPRSLLTPSVTERGPYDVYTAKRFAAPKRDYELVPGQYGVPDLGGLSSSPRPRTAEFSKIDRFPRATGMRIDMRPGIDSPGPGHYTPALLLPTTPPHHQRRKDAFGATSDRKTVFDEAIRQGMRTPTDPAEYSPSIRGTTHVARKYHQTYASALKSSVPRFEFKGQTPAFAAERLTTSYR